MTPLVSVLVPVLNGADFLDACLDSALGQDYPNLEWVISDNGSTDATPEVIARFAERDSRIQAVRHPETIPAAEHFNFCHTRISDESRYVKWLHADDTLRSDCVSRMVALAEAHPSVGLVSAYMEVNGEVKHPWAEPVEVLPGTEAVGRYLRREIPYVFGNPSALLFRSEFARREVPYYAQDQPTLSQQLDIESCYRVLMESDFGFIPEPLSSMGIHDQSITSVNQTINKRLAGQVILAKRFAPLCMSREEADAVLDMMMARYMKFLSRNLRRDQAFWDFHSEALRELGVPHPRARALREWAARLPRRVARKLGLAK